MPKDITVIPFGQPSPGAASYAVFEGFFDYLSALTLGLLPQPEATAIVLNSTSMRAPALDTVRPQPGDVHLFLDNKEAGRKAPAIIVRELADTARVINGAALYAGFEDVNAYHKKQREAQHR